MFSENASPQQPYPRKSVRKLTKLPHCRENHTDIPNEITDLKSSANKTTFKEEQ